MIGPGASDEAIVSSFMTAAAAVPPVVAMLCLADVDEVAHTGDWGGYLSAIRTADSLAVALWQWLQTTPPFVGTTALIITADHGRHDHDWTEHGCACHGCRHLPLVALGPDFKTGIEDTTLAQVWDLAPTLGWLLGVSTPYAQGRLMLEMLEGEDVPPKDPVVRNKIDGRRIVLTWSPVTTDIQANPEQVACYRVYRATTPFFAADPQVSLVGIVPFAFFVDEDPGVVGNVDLHAFYRVEPVDVWGNASAPSATVGEFDFGTR